MKYNRFKQFLPVFTSPANADVFPESVSSNVCFWIVLFALFDKKKSFMNLSS